MASDSGKFRDYWMENVTRMEDCADPVAVSVWHDAEEYFENAADVRPGGLADTIRNMTEAQWENLRERIGQTE